MSFTQMSQSDESITSQFNKPEQAHVLVCALNEADKRTVLGVIQRDKLVVTNRTTGEIFKTVILGDSAGMARKMGGRCVMRPLWQRHYENVKAVIFVVDSNDRNRIKEAREELRRITNKEELKNKPVLILANKRYLRDAMTLDELREQLSLTDLDRNTKWHIQTGCAIYREGIKDGFEWLSKTFETKTDFTKSIVETINDFKIMKNDLFSNLSLENLETSLTQFLQT